MIVSYCWYGGKHSLCLVLLSCHGSGGTLNLSQMWRILAALFPRTIMKEFLFSLARQSLSASNLLLRTLPHFFGSTSTQSIESAGTLFKQILFVTVLKILYLGCHQTHQSRHYRFKDPCSSSLCESSRQTFGCEYQPKRVILPANLQLKVCRHAVTALSNLPWVPSVSTCKIYQANDRPTQTLSISDVTAKGGVSAGLRKYED